METIAQLTEGRAWFQLYHPAKATLRNDLIDRAKAIGCPGLVLLCDVPSFGIRHMEIKNGLALPPRISARNIWQILQKTKWAWATLKQGSPSFKNLTPYMPKNQSLKQLGRFMDKTFDGRLDRDKIAAIRDMWPGKLVLKGVATQSDAEMAIELGIDGLLVSNHGGRQLDAAEATVESLDRILTDFKGKLPLMMDSGIRSGADIGRTLAHGADFTFLGRSFMYAVAALGQQGGDQAYTILKRELEQLMTQVGCPRPKELPKFTIPN
jgi:L-lactate dehydrogenase (cytochrome)